MASIFYNANIYTFDNTFSIANAMLVDNGIIKKIGCNEAILAYKNDATTCIDLKQQFVMPGFNDCHIHIWKVGDLKTFMVDLRGINSIEEMLQLLLKFKNNNPHLKWLLARGFNESVLKEKRMPTKDDLDKFFPNIPVYIIRTCAHIAVVNSKALDIAGVTEKTPVPIGGEMLLNDKGKPNGIFTETAKGLFTHVLPQYTEEAYEQMIEAACKELVSLGITSATDPAVMPDLLNVYKRLEAKNKLKVRINAIPISIPDGDNVALPLPQQYHSDFLVVDTIKFFADGGLSGATAATYTPYKNTTDNYGVLRLNYDMFYPIALEARKKNWRIATHAIGDKAIDEVIKVYKKIQEDIPSHIYNRIEHLGIPTQQQMQDIKDLNIAVVTQPIFIKELGKNFCDALNDDYIKKCYPFKSMLDNGLKVAFSTDAPVVKAVNPFEGIKAAIDRKYHHNNTFNAQENIDIKSALYAYTVGSAIAQQEDHIKGSLSEKKYADFIILNQNPFEIPTDKIDSIKVLQTYIGGEIV